MLAYTVLHLRGGLWLGYGVSLPDYTSYILVGRRKMPGENSQTMADQNEKAKLASEVCKNNKKQLTLLREWRRKPYPEPTDEELLDVITALRTSIKMLDVVYPENRFELDTEAGLIHEIREKLDLKG
jgi:hypothetical protein